MAEAVTLKQTIELAQRMLLPHTAQKESAFVDGIWGRNTSRAFYDAPPSTKMDVTVAFRRNGYDVTELLKRPLANAPAATSLATLAKASGITGGSLVNLLATVKAESGFKPRRESHFYTRPGAAQRTFSAMRGMTDSQVQALVRQGREAFFEKAYGPPATIARTLGNDRVGDGGRYYGRGDIQLTGKYNYSQFAKYSGIDVVSEPDRLLDPEVSHRAAVWYWKTFVMSRGVDTNFHAASKVVNAGLSAADIAVRFRATTDYEHLAAEQPLFA